jgi:hypothetical protein
MVDIQLKNNLGIFARLASRQPSIGDVSLCHTLSQIVQLDVASPWHVVAK